MKYIPTYKNVKSSERLNETIQEIFGKLDKHFGDEFTCYAVISEKGKGPATACVEITIKTDHQTYRAESVTEDFYKSVNENADKIKRQIKKHKTKILSKKRDRVDVSFDMPTEHEEPHFDNDVVRKKRYEIMPMSTEDAAMQLDMLDHDFYLFINEETDETNLIYKRKDGGYGIIEAVDNRV
jgi:putative sigma-54 modulation protein